MIASIRAKTNSFCTMVGGRRADVGIVDGPSGLTHRADTTALLEAILAAPSLYDEALRLLARAGFDVGVDAGQTD